MFFLHRSSPPVIGQYRSGYIHPWTKYCCRQSKCSQFSHAACKAGSHSTILQTYFKCNCAGRIFIQPCCTTQPVTKKISSSIMYNGADKKKKSNFQKMIATSCSCYCCKIDDTKHGYIWHKLIELFIFD